MIRFSRRQLAGYAVEQLLAGERPNVISAHLAAALIELRKTKEADLLIADINEELENRGLLAQATLTSANKLSEQLKARLAGTVKKAAKVNDVIINEVLDSSVIGGVRIETSLKAWDKTVARQLAEIKGGNQ